MIEVIGGLIAIIIGFFVKHKYDANKIKHLEDENIMHVSNQIDPASDIETINTELLLADLETVENGILRAEKNGKSGNKEQIALANLLRRLRDRASLDLTPERNVWTVKWPPLRPWSRPEKTVRSLRCGPSGFRSGVSS